MKTPAISGDYNRASLNELKSYGNKQKTNDLTWFQIKEKQVKYFNLNEAFLFGT